MNEALSEGRDGMASTTIRRLLRVGSTAAVSAVALTVLAPASYAGSDGADRIPISERSGSLQNPGFSPDSTQIALTLWLRRYNEGQGSVHVADLESGEVLSRVSPEGTAVNLPGSCWNPVTNLILFSLESDAPDWPYSANPDGTGLRRLVSLPGKIAIEPSFSPDGQRIAFEVSKYDAEGNGSISDGSRDTRLYRIDAPG